MLTALVCRVLIVVGCVLLLLLARNELQKSSLLLSARGTLVAVGELVQGTYIACLQIEDSMK